MTNFQNYLDKKYPTPKEKLKVREIVADYKEGLKISEQDGKFHIISLETSKKLDGGNLNLSEYQNLEKFDVDGYLFIFGSFPLKTELTNLNVNNCSQLVKLNCRYNKLTNLTLLNCSKLRKIECYNNKLNQLDVRSCEKIEQLICSDNEITSLMLPRGEKIKEINISNNQLTDLTIFSQLINLETLILDCNPINGNLISLRDLEKLKRLNICGNKLDFDLEYLPACLKEIYCDGEIENQLSAYRHKENRLTSYYDYQA